MTAAAGAALDYHSMRLRWCRLALRRFLRRWGVYVLVAALAFGAGSDSPLHAVAGAAAWLVMPLLHASTRGAWLLPAAAIQALAGVGCVWGLRGLLWPPSWAEAERALPIAESQRRRSDAIVVAFSLLPLWLLQAAGLVAVLASAPAWLQATRALAVATLLFANAAAWAGGVVLLRQLRLPPSFRLREAAPLKRGAPVRGAWPLALLWLPLWRGPARRTGHLLLAGSVALCGLALGALAGPAVLPWALAALAAGALLVVTRLRSLAGEEFAPVLEACAWLPLSPAALQRGRDLLCLLPLLPAGAALAIGLRDAAFRPAVLAAYLLACVGACAWQVRSRTTEPADQSSRWLFSLVLCLALASEVPR